MGQDTYLVESFTPAERVILERHVTAVDGPVFALTDLPEVVKGALFARYSRSPKSLRRLLLDEFAADLPPAPEHTTAAGDPRRAAQLYERIFGEYGDDSVAQLGGAHVAVEQASNLLTKVLERGRLAAYLEQSTRYVPYTDRPGGRWRYYRDPEILASAHGAAYVGDLDAVFATYTDLVQQLTVWAQARYPRAGAVPEGAHRLAVRAKVLDLLRGMLPAATASNVGIFASGQAHESLLLHLREHPLAEARATGAALLRELRQVIPAFLTRVDRPDRGEVWARYLADTRAATRAVATELLERGAAGADGQVGPGVGPATSRQHVAGEPVGAGDEVQLVAWGPPDAELDVVVGCLYPHSHLSEERLRARAAALTHAERLGVLRAATGVRGNRRHRPGRALERAWYRFDLLADYGAFRDLQRHRMLTVEWQDLTPLHGYAVPPEVDDAGFGERYRATMDRQGQLWDRLRPDFPTACQYAVGLGYRIRWSMQLNARAAMQLLELRTTPQGHPSYRRLGQRMHRLIGEVTPAVAALMTFVDYDDPELERLEAERALAARRG